VFGVCLFVFGVCLFVFGVCLFVFGVCLFVFGCVCLCLGVRLFVFGCVCLFELGVRASVCRWVGVSLGARRMERMCVCGTTG